VPAEDAKQIAEARIAQAEEKQETLGKKVPKTAMPTNRAEELTQELIDAGIPPKEAKQRATAIAEQEAKDDAEAEADTGKTVSGKAVTGADRTGAAVAKQPGKTTTAAGAEAAKPGAVVPTGATAAGATVGEESKPTALTGEEKPATPRKELDQQKVEAMADAELATQINNINLRDREYELVKAEVDKRKSQTQK
jgi:hypothetical protein